jgi:hypothetical protein
MTNAQKFLLMLASLIIVCILCVIAFKITNEGKSAINGYTNNFNNMTGQYQDIEKAIYDGSAVQGSEVVNLIKNVIKSDEELAIRVSTKASANRDYNYNFTAETTTTPASLGTHITTSVDIQLADNKTDTWYINTNAPFIGKVYKDANDLIICIEFVQQ